MALSNLYAKRVEGEELFRGDENGRNGYALRNARLLRADHVDRPLLILALAFILPYSVGPGARQRYRSGMWCRSNDPGQCGVFTLGRTMLDHMRLSPASAVATVSAAITETAPTWGCPRGCAARSGEAGAMLFGAVERRSSMDAGGFDHFPLARR